MLRLFVGLGLPDGVAARLSILCAGVPGASWVEPANLHLTLRFIGEVEEHEAEEIDGLLAGITAPAFSLTLAGVNTFGEGAKARAVWAAVQPSAALSHLQAKVESAVVRAGRPAEGRKFTPHVTLARLHKPQPPRLAAFLEGNAPFQAGPFRIEHFTLFESRPGKGSPVYIPLVDYSLN
ncbi:MAG: RNA 2',3'-cyclic phosphodiesterase [Rhodospirillaceae bacterium]|nr:RNA 2',3'-cyclic phosphodiesterase [Rhodospirillaceae bacterium]